MNVDEIKSTAIREISALRQDLQDLKRCQLQYFTLAITGTGAVLGLSVLLDANFKGIALLVPLCVILPTWVIFFDKATTITRIVGYQITLEKQISAKEPVYRCLGYETALAEFRAREKEAEDAVRSQIKSKRPSLFTVLILRTRHRF